MENERLAEVLDFCKEQAQNRKQHVYVLRCGEYYKIGIAYDLKARVELFQTGNPIKIEIIHSYPCADAPMAEKAIHSAFQKYQVRGEWFSLGPEHLNIIHELVIAIDGTAKRIDHQVPVEPKKQKRPPGVIRIKKTVSDYWFKDYERSFRDKDFEI